MCNGQTRCSFYGVLYKYKFLILYFWFKYTHNQKICQLPLNVPFFAQGDIAKARIGLYVSLYGAHTQFQCMRGILMVSQRHSEFYLFLIDPRDLANIVLLYYYLRADDGPTIGDAYTPSKFITSRTVPV